MRTLKLAARKLGPGVLLLQWFGNLVVMLVAFAWLQIPDSHMWQFLFSILLAVLLALSFLWLHTRTFRILHSTSSVAPLWRRLLILLIVFIVVYLLLRGIGAGRGRESLFAGYWNSRFSAGMRSFFTYPRLVQLQESLYDLLQWLLLAILAPVAFVGAGGGLHREGWVKISKVYRRPLYWLVAVMSGLLGFYFTFKLASWTPGHGVSGEIISAMLRFGLVYTVDILLWCFVLAVIAVIAETPKPNEPAPAP